MDIENVGSVLRVYAFFTRKMSVNQLNIRGVCRCHASINLFWLRKIFNCFVRYKTIPTLLCKDRRWCPDESPMFWSPTWYWSRRMLFDKMGRGESLLFILKQAQSM